MRCKVLKSVRWFSIKCSDWLPCSLCFPAGGLEQNVRRANRGSLPCRWCGKRRTLSITCTALPASCAAGSWPPGMSFTSWRTGGWCARWTMRQPSKTVRLLLYTKDILQTFYFIKKIQAGKVCVHTQPDLCGSVLMHQTWNNDTRITEKDVIKLSSALCNAVRCRLAVDLCCLSSGCGCCLPLFWEFLQLWLIM